jgi:hypothetical protein
MSVLKVNHPDVRQIFIDVPEIAANTTQDVVASGILGIKSGELYLVALDLSFLDDGLGYCATAKATDDKTLTIRFINPTASPIDPAVPVPVTYLQL